MPARREVRPDPKRLLPVRLRLDGLRARLDRTDPDFEGALREVSEETRVSLEITDLTIRLRGVERGFEGVVKALCLALDGTVPDEGDWYPEALTQLTRTGRGRAPVLSAELTRPLTALLEEELDVLTTDKGERLRRLRARQEAARDAFPRLTEAVAALSAPVRAAPPDPDLLAAEPGRLERAAAREAAMGRAAAAISEAFDERGRRAVPFGSVLDGPVHGGSDLDIMVPGEMSREERNALWDLAERIAAEEGVELDIHFEHMYRDGFLDELRTVRDGRVVTLRELVEKGGRPRTLSAARLSSATRHRWSVYGLGALRQPPQPRWMSTPPCV